MQSFNFGIGRKSVADSVDDRRSRYAASSVYSGVVEDAPAPSTAALFSPVALQGPFEEEEPGNALSNGTHLNGTHLNDTHLNGTHLNGTHLNGTQSGQNPSVLNIYDPVAMHLLMETAINDSSDYEVLSYDEVEQLKKERAFLKHRVDATKRKLALETKMRDAAHSLNRLYSNAGRRLSPELKADGDGEKPTRKRALRGIRGSGADPQSLADGEYSASRRKVQELSQELLPLEKRLAACDRRLLEHTAAILQMTHKGLQKNARQNPLPHSPESMASQARRGSRTDGIDDFDERSLYQLSDSVVDAEHNSKMKGAAFGDMTKQLDALAQRLHTMVVQAAVHEHFDAPPQPDDDPVAGKADAIVKAQMVYIEQGLDAIEGVQARAMVDAQRQLFDSEDRIEHVNTRLNQLLAQTNSVSQSPELDQGEARGKDLPSQLAFATTLLNRLEKRVEVLVEQKDILTRQIQQQRELNSKSDAQRDAKIVELSEELERTRQLREVSGQESQQTADQLNMLMEQLDQARQESVLLEQKHGTAQQELEQQRGLHGQAVETLRSTHRDELEKQKSLHQQALDESKAEAEHLQSEVVRFQTELTMAKAELDGAYGSRAQRAAEMSTGLSKKNEELEDQINALQTELKETIEDYEVMTKQSLDFEKERDRLEEKIDQLERRCDSLESQLHEEKVKGLGSVQAVANQTASTAILKGEFKKMMRDARVEHMKTFKAEQEERRRLEGIIRNMRKEMAQMAPAKKVPSTAVNGGMLAP
ncbi:hypothetical protein DV737_g3845, partial [Chaetothyriales sp. CBS 132003]